MISIIIPVHNCLDYTKQCLESVRENTQDYEVIIVDNGSTDGTWGWLKEQANSIVDFKKAVMEDGIALLQPDNLGFVQGINRGMMEAKGDYICWLNNDVVVTPNWIERMRAHKLDIIGPCSNFVAGKQCVRVALYRDHESLYQVAEDFSKKKRKKYERVRWIIGFCMLFRREVYDQLGLLDTGFGLGNSEDIDYCMRAHDAGFSIGIAQDVYIHHYGHVTFKEVGGHGLCPRLVAENRVRLAKKWGKDHDYRQEL